MFDDRLLAVIDAAPSDRLALLLLADHLEDQGDERATGVRWLAHQQKAPLRTFTTWNWYLLRTTNALSPTALPFEEKEEGQWRPWYRPHPTPSAAYLSAAREFLRPEYDALK
jgi:uncharacterized protein (TIGR02996 family)